MYLRSRFGRNGIYTDPRVGIPLVLMVVAYFVLSGINDQRQAEQAQRQQAVLEQQLDVVMTGDRAQLEAQNRRLRAQRLAQLDRARGTDPGPDAAPVEGSLEIRHVHPDGSAASSTNWALIGAVGAGGLMGGIGVLGAWALLRTTEEEEDDVVVDPDVAALVEKWERGELDTTS
jgi:hypothetical protein